MKRGIGSIIGILIILIGVGMLFSNQIREDNQTTSLRGIETIIIDGSSEQISIVKVSGDDIKAKLTGKSSGFSISKPKLNMKKTGSTLKIYVKRPWFSLFSSGKLTVDVYISENYHENLDIDISSGTVDIADDFELDNFAVNMSSGKVTTNKITSERIDIDVSSGTVQLNGISGEVDGEISSGNIYLEYDQLDADINFSISSGDLNILLPESSEFELNVDVSSGSVTSDFELDDLEKDGNDISGVVGSGDHKIELDVSSGRVKIQKK